MGGYELKCKANATAKSVNNLGNGRIDSNCSDFDVDCNDRIDENFSDTEKPIKRKMRKRPQNVLSYTRSETEIVAISQSTECSIPIRIGDRDYKTLWDTGASQCVISKDKYTSLPEEVKTPLRPSKVIIKAAQGSIIDNSGECEITFKIGPAQFTFPFLCSNILTQGIILGFNFKQTFHIGTDWNRNDEMYLKMNGQPLTSTINTKDINALVQCVEPITIPPRSNARIACKASKLAMQENLDRVCRFEPSKRLNSITSFGMPMKE